MQHPHLLKNGKLNWEVKHNTDFSSVWSWSPRSCTREAMTRSQSYSAGFRSLLRTSAWGSKGDKDSAHSRPLLPRKEQEWVLERKPPWQVHEQTYFSSQGERGGCEWLIYPKDTVCSLFCEQGSCWWPNRSEKKILWINNLWSISSCDASQNRQNPCGEACASPWFHRSVVPWGEETLVTLAHSSSW